MPPIEAVFQLVRETETHELTCVKFKERLQNSIGSEYAWETLLPIATQIISFQSESQPELNTACIIAASRKEKLDSFEIVGAIVEAIQVDTNFKITVTAATNEDFVGAEK